MKDSLKNILDQKVDYYNRPFFIDSDPISIPHLFSKKQDIEIAGFFAAIFAWGNRTTIINKSKELMKMMDFAPHEFIVQHQENDLKKLLGFKHRTFNPTDLLYCIQFLQHHYTNHNSLEDAFCKWMKKDDQHIENALQGFHDYFFSLEYAPERTRKHIATPANASSCKRLCMYLRWMVRKDKQGVDFGIWKKINPSQLIIPIDVHVMRVSKALNLLDAQQPNWNAALALTDTLKQFDSQDPVKYDFALFGMGVMEFK